MPDPEALTWLRFIGGSTNTISHRYGDSRIMTRLKEQAAERGYHTIDWNVSAEDAAGGHPGAATILRNIVKDAKERDVCVVLMHDKFSAKKAVGVGFSNGFNSLVVTSSIMGFGGLVENIINALL